MILVGQYDSPFVRRVAVSLRILGFGYVHDTRSVFGDFESIRATNPLGRIPSLIRDDGDTLIDSAAILDWLDETVGPGRALIPASGPARRMALQKIALATGAIDKIGAANYERLVRPAAYRWPDWIERCLTQFDSAVMALEKQDWPLDVALDQVGVTTACMVFYVQVTDPDRLQAQRFPKLAAFAAHCRELEAFKATSFSEYAVPRAE